MVSFRMLFPVLLVASAWIPAGAQNPFQQVASKLSAADIKQAAAAAIDNSPMSATCGCLAEWVAHARKSTKERWYYLTYTLSITYTNGNVIYSEGNLTWNAATRTLQQVPLSGDTAYYNDSRDSSGHPFKFNNQQPNVRILIRGTDCFADITRAVTHTVRLQCNGNLLYGFPASQGEGYLISLVKRDMLVPR